ncbi:MAG TPA: hypothetical protein DCS43_05330 [Verrucomicrobia bacterium]|nr:hypothetical protein [Verrucomicrobiota bacterium]
METLYYRVRQGNRASIDLINIGEKSIRGTIRIDLAPLATIGNVVPISVTLNGQALATASLPSGQQSSWESPIAELKAGTNVLHFQSQLPGYNGLAVLNNAWQTTE